MTDIDSVHESHGTVSSRSPDNSEIGPFREETHFKADVDGMSSVWIKFREHGFSRDVLQIIKEWLGINRPFSLRNGRASVLKSFHPTVNDVLNFLSTLYRI